MSSFEWTGTVNELTSSVPQAPGAQEKESKTGPAAETVFPKVSKT